MLSLKQLLVVGAVVLPVASIACASEDATNDESEDVSESGEALTNKQVSLKYEGTCEFLRSCSRWSRGLPEGNVLWGCGQYNSDGDDGGSCGDDDLWVAGPTRGYCGKTARICRGNTCINARVKDISVSRDWEASNGVMAALGLPYGLTGRCSGFGGGRVTVSTP